MKWLISFKLIYLGTKFSSFLSEYHQTRSIIRSNWRKIVRDVPVIRSLELLSLHSYFCHNRTANSNAESFFIYFIISYSFSNYACAGACHCMVPPVHSLTAYFHFFYFFIAFVILLVFFITNLLTEISRLFFFFTQNSKQPCSLIHCLSLCRSCRLSVGTCEYFGYVVCVHDFNGIDWNNHQLIQFDNQIRSSWVRYTVTAHRHFFSSNFYCSFSFAFCSLYHSFISSRYVCVCVCVCVPIFPSPLRNLHSTVVRF